MTFFFFSKVEIDIKNVSSAPSKELWVSYLLTYHLIYGNNLVSHQSPSFLTWCHTSVGLYLLSFSKEAILCG